MRVQPVAASQNRRVVAGLPFVEALARRMAATMPNSIDIGDLVQDGVIGLIDAAFGHDAEAFMLDVAVRAQALAVGGREPPGQPAQGPAQGVQRPQRPAR